MLQKKTSKEIWDSTRRKYQGSTRVKRAQLQAVRRDFEILQMQKGETMNDYIGKVISLASKMRMHGDSITDVAVVEKILRSLTSKLDYTVCSIEEANNVEEMQIDELQSSLLVHEQRLNRTSAIEEMIVEHNSLWETLAHFIKTNREESTRHFFVETTTLCYLVFLGMMN